MSQISDIVFRRNEILNNRTKGKKTMSVVTEQAPTEQAAEGNGKTVERKSALAGIGAKAKAAKSKGAKGKGKAAKVPKVKVEKVKTGIENSEVWKKGVLGLAPTNTDEAKAIEKTTDDLMTGLVKDEIKIGDRKSVV